MPIRHETRSSHERAHQQRLDRSWSHARSALADPEWRAYLEASIERANRSISDETLSAETFLAVTDPSEG